MLHTQLIGSGPRTVVLLHGFLGSGRNLASLARRWAELDPSRSFLLVDLTGHGASPPLPEGATLGTMAADVLASARHQGLFGPIEIVGHSMGGRVGLALRRDHPEEAGPLTLLDIAPGPIREEADDGGGLLRILRTLPDRFAAREEARAALTERGVPRPLADWVLMNLVPDGGGYRWRIDREGLARFRPELTEPDLWEAIAASKAPVRAIRGARSPYVNDEDVRQFEAAGVEVTTLADAGHFVHVDALEPLARLLEHRSPDRSE